MWSGKIFCLDQLWDKQEDRAYLNLYQPCNIETEDELASDPASLSATHKAQIEVPLCKDGKYFFFNSGLPCLLRTSAPYQEELAMTLLRLRLALATSSRNLNDSVKE